MCRHIRFAGCCLFVPSSAVGDIVRSLERGDRLRIDSIEVENGILGERVKIGLTPLGMAFIAYAAIDDELNAPVLAGYWKE